MSIAFKNINGQYHRENGPAIIFENGDAYWFINGKLHREDGPAIENSNGSKEWFVNGKLHREDGPAIQGLYSNEWYFLGKLQRKESLRNLYMPYIILFILSLTTPRLGFLNYYFVF